MAQKNEQPRWLMKDGKTSIFAAADIENAKTAGWKEPDAPRANGEPWNPAPDPDESGQLDGIAAVSEQIQERDAKRAKRHDKEQAEAMKAAEASGEEASRSSALKVEVVNVPKAEKKSAK